MREIRYAMRSLLRTPAFTIATVLTLAIGIGAATAIYSVVDTILFRPLPFPGGDRLVRLVEYGPHFRAGQPPLQRGINYPGASGLARSREDDRGGRRHHRHVAADGEDARRRRRSVGRDGVGQHLRVAADARACSAARCSPRTKPNPDGRRAQLRHLAASLPFRSVDHRHGRSKFRMGALLAPRPPLFLTVVGVLPADFEFPTGTLDFVMPIALDPSQPLARRHDDRAAGARRVDRGGDAGSAMRWARRCARRGRPTRCRRPDRDSNIRA